LQKAAFMKKEVIRVEPLSTYLDHLKAPASVVKLCLETAGSSLANVLKCNVYCTSPEKFAAVNAIYARYFPKDPPARIFVCVPAWFGPFDIEIDCIAACD
jgi:2-iminobutanoate/2-iminopropanoate deaminase